MGSTALSKHEWGRKLLLVADNQEHLLTGGPIRTLSPLSERYLASVAVRSPLANVGGLQLLRETLRFGRREGADLFLHLGDAADISCPDELTSVFNALDDETRGIHDDQPNWFMTPGNHDGLLGGSHANYQPSFDFDINKHPWIYTTPPIQGLKGVERGWLNACLSPSNSREELRANILTRGDAINLYLDRLKARRGTVPKALGEEVVKFDGPRSSTIRVRCKVEEVENKSQDFSAFARTCQRTRVPGARTWVGPYASFIIQKVEVGSTRIILLDTSYYENPTSIGIAFNGSIAKDQRDLVEKYFLESSNRTNLIIIGHHPLDDLPEGEQQWIKEKSGRYISAHVHRTTNLIEHWINDKKTIELNIGSTLDYPPQAVVAHISPHGMAFRVAGADVAKTEWPGFLKNCETNRAKWMLNLEFYRNYTRSTYVKHLLESLREAEAVRRSAAVRPLAPDLEIPSGTKVRDWLLLDRALQTIREDNKDSGLFWACQAYYASEATRRERGLGERLLSAFGKGSKSGIEATGWWFPFNVSDKRW